MRTAILFLIARAASAQFASIAGTAVDTLTHQPLPGVHLLLMSLDTTSGRPTPGAAYGAMSKADGTFSIVNVAPGGYLVMPERAGFVYMPGEKAGGLTLKAGERLSGYTVDMTPRATIAGRVLDEYGEPVPRVQVSVTSINKTPQTMFRAMTAVTNERGEYKLIGAPGKYYVKANERQMLVGSGMVEIRSDGSIPVTYGIVQSAAVDVGAGQDIIGIDLRLTPQHTMSIRGTITGIPAGAKRPVTVLLIGQRAGQFGSVQYASSEPNGHFMFSNVLPGAYRCFARMEETPRMFSQMAEVRVDAGDETVGLKLSAGEELSGTVDMGGVKAEKVTVHAELATALDRSLLGGGSEAEVGSDGAFRMSGVFPGKLRIRVEPLPENAYVKSVRVDNVEAPNALVDFSRGVTPSRIKVTLSPSAAEISGQVLDKAGVPLQSPLARVIISAGGSDVDLYGDAKSVGPGGRYSIRGIRPGKYHVVAFDALGSPGTPEEMNALISAAEVMEFKENDRIVRDLKVATPGVANAK